MTSVSYDPDAPFLGSKEISLLCARTLQHLFPLQHLDEPEETSPGSEQTEGHRAEDPSDAFAHWVAYLLFRTRLPTLTIMHALHLLLRLSLLDVDAIPPSFLEPMSPTSASLGDSVLHYRLFLAAAVLATAYNMDDAYSIRSWAIASQFTFPVRAINQLQLDLLDALGWRLQAEGERIEDIVQLYEEEWQNELAQRESSRWREERRRQAKLKQIFGVDPEELARPLSSASNQPGSRPGTGNAPSLVVPLSPMPTAQRPPRPPHTPAPPPPKPVEAALPIGTLHWTDWFVSSHSARRRSHSRSNSHERPPAPNVLRKHSRSHSHERHSHERPPSASQRPKTRSRSRSNERAPTPAAPAPPQARPVPSPSVFASIRAYRESVRLQQQDVAAALGPTLQVRPPTPAAAAAVVAGPSAEANPDEKDFGTIRSSSCFPCCPPRHGGHRARPSVDSTRAWVASQAQEKQQQQQPQQQRASPPTPPDQALANSSRFSRRGHGRSRSHTPRRSRTPSRDRGGSAPPMVASASAPGPHAADARPASRSFWDFSRHSSSESQSQEATTAVQTPATGSASAPPPSSVVAPWPEPQDPSASTSTGAHGRNRSGSFPWESYLRSRQRSTTSADGHQTGAGGTARTTGTRRRLSSLP